ncbi:AAEL014863-PD [Aedes aegypti]|uniref:glycogenin glucosyltransferase n=1 Tax=Aedes aegypti TaxID=7159 RepID=Q16F88_AEDAE|nr:AAEL014863-PD [Aedes aegypti]
MKNKLRTIFNVVEEVNLLDSKDEANLALLKRPELGITFTKLHCWRLTQFEKCVFLDADTLVLRNCDELFEREELSAAPDVGWPDCFNSGVYVFRPSLETFSNLMQYAVTNGSFDGGDQGLLNSYFSDWAHKDIAKHLPFIYNTSSVASYSYLPAFKQFGQNTKILHFIGTAKPWLQNFNSESRKVYIPGGYQHLANFLQYWWDIFCEDVHSRLSADMSGLAGALSQLHLGEPKSTEQEVYEEHMRRQCWESGNIDYMGRDSFENIWRRISQTVSAGPSPAADSTASPAPSSTPLRAVSPAPRRHRSSKSRSRSTTPKRDPRDRSPTPQPEDIVPVEKKEGYQQIITTKTQEGKTHTRTKTVYDPSVDDDLAGDDAIDGPMHVTSATVAESRIEPAMPLVESETKTTPAPPTTKITTTLEDTPTPKPTPAPITTETAPTPPTSKIIPAPATPEETIAPPTPKPTPTPLATETAPAPPTSKTTPPPAPVPEPEHKSTPPRASPRPQLEQQVAQESMAATKAKKSTFTNLILSCLPCAKRNGIR